MNSSARTPTVFIFLRFCIAFAAVVATPAEPPALSPPGIYPSQSVHAQNGVVVSVSAAASDIGISILKEGGNAVDAAVATAFALAVTYPAAGNIGGGGFMLVHPAPGR